ncbi:MAG: hypothetical protein HC841_06465 [Verrucomicrobiae bacterium]|nr:hypothetical protein [Verrucomicrobiae bacterium]
MHPRILIAHMALDHASLMFNAGRGAEELAAVAPAAPADFLQFLMRFTGVPVAPGFFFMAGFMVALTSVGRAQRGVLDAMITRQLIIRGLVLLAVDALIMGLPRAAMGFYSFVVLSSVGAGIILLALVRHLPSRVAFASGTCGPVSASVAQRFGAAGAVACGSLRAGSRRGVQVALSHHSMGRDRRVWICRGP